MSIDKIALKAIVGILLSFCLKIDIDKSSLEWCSSVSQCDIFTLSMVNYWTLHTIILLHWINYCLSLRTVNFESLKVHLRNFQTQKELTHEQCVALIIDLMENLYKNYFHTCLISRNRKIDSKFAYSPWHSYKDNVTKTSMLPGV